MTGTLPILATVLARAHSEIVQHWSEALRGERAGLARELIPEVELVREMRAIVDAMRELFESGATEVGPDCALGRQVRSAVGLRAARGFAPEDTVFFVQAGKEAVIDAVRSHLGTDAAGLAQATTALSRVFDGCTRLLVTAFVTTREEMIRRQSESLRDLSTPVITVWDSMLLLPLVGIIDSVRARQIAESLLESIGRTEAQVTLIDVTGVPVLDTAVARHLLKTVTAAELLGTRVILTGISPETAQTIVKLGIDLSGVPTCGSLRGGVQLAFRMLGLSVVRGQGD